jgi:hypothetical protein
MAIKKVKEIFQRKLRQIWDVDHIQNVIYNEASGSQMNLNVEAVVRDTYTANASVQFGTYIKVAAGTTAYTVDCVGKAYDTAYTNYRRGDLVTNGSDIYIANQDFTSGIAAGTFDAEKWVRVAPKTIASIPTTAGAVVCVGKYHNSINVNGFIVDDTSFYSKVE